MAVAKAKNQSAAMILLARRSPDMVYEYSGWQIARYLNKQERVQSAIRYSLLQQT